MAISYVSSTGLMSSQGITGFQINKPASTQSGDLLVAVLSYMPTSNSERSVNVPSGWTLVRSAFASHSFPHQTVVLTRVLGSSEPGSWSGSFSSTMNGGGTITACYRGASGFVSGSHGESSAGTVTSYSTATVNNPDTNNWRFTAAGYTSTSISFSIQSNEVFDVRIEGNDYGTDAIQLGAWDDGGTSSSGNTSRTISRSQPWDSSASFIGILSAEDPTVSGTMSATFPKPTISMAGASNYFGTMSVSMLKPMISIDAEMAIPAVLDVDILLPVIDMTGTPTDPEGGLEYEVNVVVSMTAATAATGVFEILHGPEMNLIGETVRSGIRVIKVEAETRTITPLLGADTTTEENLASLFVQGLRGGDSLGVILPLPVVRLEE